MRDLLFASMDCLFATGVGGRLDWNTNPQPDATVIRQASMHQTHRTLTYLGAKTGGL